MYDNYNYPPGADTPSAPWNQIEPDPIEIDAEVTVLLKGTIRVEADIYEDDGSFKSIANYKIVEDACKDQCNTIPELLDELAKYINGELTGGNLSNHRRQELETMLEDCQGWQMVDMEVDEFSLTK